MLPDMLRYNKLLALTVLALLITAGLSACGNGGDMTVATVGKTKISRGTLNHWMSTVVGGDYNQVVAPKAPLGLVSEPADYSRCVAAAAQIVPKTNGKLKLNASQIGVKCRQLHRAIKEQALSYLIGVLWRAEEGVELGQTVSDREVARQLQQVNYKQFANPARFRLYLASRRWSLSDELYLLKRNMLDTKFLARLKQRAESLGGGERIMSKLVRENVAKWTARTSCAPGYHAWQCKQYGTSKEASPSASVLLEHFSAGVG